MLLPAETQVIHDVLTHYAEALNAANAALLPAFYTSDGTFLPDGQPTLPARALAASGRAFFARRRFHIHYTVQEVLVQGPYAFVQSTAHTTTTELASGQAVRRRSRDFFVLRQQAQKWKIFRYLFNNVQVQ